jgi:hypothetical protein
VLPPIAGLTLAPYTDFTPMLTLNTVITELIIVLSMILFVFWVMRALLILTGSAEQINLVLERDLRLTRKILLLS